MEKIYLTGYTPYPAAKNDARLPHLAAKISRQIHKTALGAEDFVAWEHSENINAVFAKLRADSFTVTALEQVENSIKLPEFKPPAKIALVVGREVEGIEPEVLTICDLALEIPMHGQKESFNVTQAAAIALYHCRFASVG